MKLENGKLVADFSRHDLIDSEGRGLTDYEERTLLNNYVVGFANDVGSKQHNDIKLLECIALSALNSKARGFWDEPRNHGEMYMLMVRELSEAFEELRNPEIDVDHVSEELADVMIRLLDYVGGFGLTDSFLDSLQKKFIKNASRPYKHGKTC